MQYNQPYVTIADSTTYNTAKPGTFCRIHNRHGAHLESIAHLKYGFSSTATETISAQQYYNSEAFISSDMYQLMSID